MERARRERRKAKGEAKEQPGTRIGGASKMERGHAVKGRTKLAPLRHVRPTGAVQEAIRQTSRST